MTRNLNKLPKSFLNIFLLTFYLKHCNTHNIISFSRLFELRIISSDRRNSNSKVNLQFETKIRPTRNIEYTEFDIKYFQIIF